MSATSNGTATKLVAGCLAGVVASGIIFWATMARDMVSRDDFRELWKSIAAIKIDVSSISVDVGAIKARWDERDRLDRANSPGK